MTQTSQPTATGPQEYVAIKEFFVEQELYEAGREFTEEEIGPGRLSGLIRTEKAVAAQDYDPAALEAEHVLVEEPGSALYEAGVSEPIAEKLIAVSLLSPAEVIEAAKAELLGEAKLTDEQEKELFETLRAWAGGEPVSSEPVATEPTTTTPSTTGDNPAEKPDETDAKATAG